MILLGFVGRVPVGIQWRDAARPRASQHLMPLDGPSTTASDGAVLPWRTSPGHPVPGQYPCDPCTPPYTMGTPSIVPATAHRRPTRCTGSPRPDRTSRNVTQRHLQLANHDAAIPPCVIDRLVNPYVTGPITKRNLIATAPYTTDCYPSYTVPHCS